MHYFRPANLARLADNAGFTQVLSTELPAVRAGGLMARLRCAGDLGIVALYANYVAVMLALPLLRAFPSDIVVGVFRRRAA